MAAIQTNAANTSRLSNPPSKPQQNVSKRVVVMNPMGKPKRNQHINQAITTAYDNDPRDSTRKPISQSVKWKQPLGISDILNGWDRYTIARAYPGSVESPYLNNMTIMPLPTGNFSISKGLSTMWYADENPVPDLIGQGDYVCLFWCPALSSYLGPGGTNNFSTSTRLSGFASVQTNSLSFNCSDGLFINSNYAQACSSLYGSDFTAFASGGFVWSGRIS